MNTHTEYQLIGSMKNTTVNNLYNIGDSTKLVALENGGDISTVYAVDTVSASDFVRRILQTVIIFLLLIGAMRRQGKTKHLILKVLISKTVR